MKNRLISILLIAGILLLVNLLSRQFFFRLDLTQDKQYTLSKATKDILKNIETPVMVSAYFTEDLPQQYKKSYTDFQDLLIEYSARSKGMLDYEFIDPNESPELEQQAAQNGISPLLINVREKDAAVQKKAFMGAVISAGEQTDIIPFVQPEGPMEYQLTTSVKKVSASDKPAVGLIQGHGEVGFQELAIGIQAMSVLYDIQPVDMNAASEIPSFLKTVILVRPTDTIPPAHLAMIDNYLANGGNLVLAVDRVQGNFQTAQGTALSVGLEDWLSQKGIGIAPSFVIDASCGSVSVQQQQGFFTMNIPVEFPYFPAVQAFEEHPITQGIEQVLFQFASPISYFGDSSATFTPLVKTSVQSGIQQAPTYFDIQRQWTASDFTSGNQTIGALLQPRNGGKILLFSDGDFALAGQGVGGQLSDNVSLLVNGVDFLSDDTGLIDLRTKGVTTRPIEELEDGTKATIKWVNFLLPIILVLVYGFIRFQQNRNRRIRRMVERYVK